MAQAENADFDSMGRWAQIRQVLKLTAQADKKFVPLVVVAVGLPLIALGLMLGLGSLGIVGTILWVVLWLLIAFMAFNVVLRMRSQKVFMDQAEQTPGASVQVIENIRRADFRVTPAIASTTQFDMVHLVLSRKGVMLVGEGPNTARIRQLMGTEKRRLAKVIGSAEMSDMIIGNEEGQVPIRKLESTLRRMPNVIAPADVNALDRRLKALTARPAMPKGAIPKNMRPSQGAFRMPRGR